MKKIHGTSCYVQTYYYLTSGDASVTLGEQEFGIAGQQVTSKGLRFSKKIFKNFEGIGIGENGEGISLTNQATPLLGGFEQTAKNFFDGLKNMFGGGNRKTT